MSIKLGNSNITLKVGSSAVTAAYLGSTQVYPNSIPPILVGFKYKLTLSDSSVVSAACDGTSAITQAEISAYTSTTVAVEIGECVTSIGTNAFRNFSGITSVELPDSVVSISDGAFRSCTNLASISLPSSLTSIGGGTFRSCTNLGSAVIPSSVSGISYDVFSDCVSLSSVTIPSSVTSIGYTAFKRCSGLTSVDIPSGVTRIAFEAFSYCTNLERITVEAVVPPTLEQNVFYGSTCPIYVPCESVEAYKSASVWSTYESRITCIPTPTFDGKYKLTLNDGSVVSAECDGTSAITKSELGYNQTACTNVEIGNCVTTINDEAFRDYRNITNLIIGDNVTSIGIESFSYCGSLTGITIPNSVATIGREAFTECNSLTHVDIPDSVISIGVNAFASCINLTGITIGNGVTSIGTFAFVHCTSLTSVTINAVTPPTIGSMVFQDTNDAPIYVPAASVDIYKSATGWSEYADRIQAIP